MVWHRGKRMVTEATWTLGSFRGSKMRQDDTTAFSLAALADHSHAYRSLRPATCHGSWQ